MSPIPDFSVDRRMDAVAIIERGRRQHSEEAPLHPGHPGGILGVLEHHPRMRPGTRPICHFILGCILEASWSFFLSPGMADSNGPQNESSHELHLLVHKHDTSTHIQHTSTCLSERK